MSYSFWEIIEKAKEKSGNDRKSRPDSLKNILLTLSPEDICQFNIDYHKKFIDAYRWNLWGAAYLIKGGCPDDEFDYFRDFLISEGKGIFEAALGNPDSLAELDDIGNAGLEAYRYVSEEAYEELANTEIPLVNLDYPTDPKGDDWEEEDLDSMFPNLAAKYG